MIKTYKAEVRIPTKMYAYLNIQVDGTPEEIVRVHDEFTALVNRPKGALPGGDGKPPVEIATDVAEGLDRLLFNKALDQYLLDKSMDSDAYEKMSDEQKGVVQELKKAFKRITVDEPEVSEEKDQQEYIHLCRLLDVGTPAQKKMAASKLKNVYGEDADKGLGDGEGEEKELNHSSVR